LSLDPKAEDFSHIDYSYMKPKKKRALIKRSELAKKYRKDALIEYVTILDEEIEIFKLGLSYTDFRNYLDVASHVGIDSILYTIEDTESLFSDYKQKLSTFPDRELLRTWCINMHARARTRRIWFSGCVIVSYTT